MHPKALIFSAAVATAAADQIINVNNFPPTCVKALVPILTDFPQPPKVFGTVINFTSAKQCSTTFAASATPQVVSYGSALEKWYTGHSNDFKNGMASCTEIAGFSEVNNCGKALIAANAGRTTSAASASATATATSSASKATTSNGSSSAGSSESQTASANTDGASKTVSSAASSSTSEGIGARETGMAAAVVAAAGLVAALL